MRKLLERGRERGKAVREIFRQTAQISRNLSGFSGQDHEVEVDGGGRQRRGREDSLSVPLFGLAGSRGAHSGQAFAGDGSTDSRLPGLGNLTSSGNFFFIFLSYFL